METLPKNVPSDVKAVTPLILVKHANQVTPLELSTKLVSVLTDTMRMEFQTNVKNVKKDVKLVKMDMNVNY